MVVTMIKGTTENKAIAQDALTRWCWRLVMFHGPPTDPAKDRAPYWRVKAKANFISREECFAKNTP